MLTTNQINEIINVKESYQASDKLSTLLLDTDLREKLFNEFLKHESDLSFDWFTDYFQEEHSDRKGKKQDFTPKAVAQLSSNLLGQSQTSADLCTGTGGLTIQRWNTSPDSTFYCEEFSDRAFPFLLFNLSIRNMNATVVHGNTLTREVTAVYKLTKTETFSKIEKGSIVDNAVFNTLIMNPPYSLPWDADKSLLEDLRFKEYKALAPKSKADYAFIQTGVSMLDENGTMAVILPHGVLFRGGSEGKIRKHLLENNLIHAIIGLPEKVFFGTDIPTCIMIIKKNRSQKDILFIDAKDEYEKGKTYNIIKEENINKILDTYNARKTVDKFSNLVKFDEIKENDYNLNIPRYVDTFEEEEPTDMVHVGNDIKKIRQEQQVLEKELLEAISSLQTTPENEMWLQGALEVFKHEQ